jgi:hypothetical protein
MWISFPQNPHFYYTLARFLCIIHAHPIQTELCSTQKLNKHLDTPYRAQMGHGWGALSMPFLTLIIDNQLLMLIKVCPQKINGVLQLPSHASPPEPAHPYTPPMQQHPQPTH